MPISLEKGQKVSLTKNNPNLVHILAGLGWDTNKYSGGAEFDLDASAFLLKNGKVRTTDDFVFYNQPKDAAASVVYGGDNRTGEGEGDDETLTIDLSKIPADIDRIVFTVTIYDAKARSQNFGMVTNAFIRLVDLDTGVELMRYDLTEDASVETALKFASLYRNGPEWKFEAIGAGYMDGLATLCSEFGVDTM